MGMNATEVMAVIEKLPVREQEEVLTLLARKIIARHELAMKSEDRKNFYFDGTSEKLLLEKWEFPGLLAKS
jgi:hypothetical protein